MPRLAREGRRQVRAGALFVLAVLAAPSSAAAQPRTVRFDPNPGAIVGIGQTAVVSVHVDDATAVSAYSFGITFDPAVVHVRRVDLGALLAPDNLACDAFSKATDNGGGAVCVSIACVSPAGGGGNVLDLTFEAKGLGVSALTFAAGACPAGSAPGGCMLNEGAPSCGVEHGQIGVQGPTPTVPPTPTPTSTSTSTRTPTPTASSTGTRTPTPTITNTSTRTPTAAPSSTSTPTPTTTATPSVQPTSTASATGSPQATSTPTETGTATVTTTPSPTPSASAIGTATQTPTQTRPAVTPGVCGNGVLDPGEECDDGNEVTHDSCPSGPLDACRYSAAQVLGRGTKRNPLRDRRSCLFEWYVVHPNREADRFGLPALRQTCDDGDPGCDFDPAPEFCEFRAVVCLNVEDGRLPSCVPRGVNAVAVTVRGRSGSPAVAVANGQNAATAQRAILELLDPLAPELGHVHGPPLSAAQRNFCSAAFPLRVPVSRQLRRKSRETISLKAKVTAAGSERPLRHASKLKLTCQSLPSLGAALGRTTEPHPRRRTSGERPHLPEPEPRLHQRNIGTSSGHPPHHRLTVPERQPTSSGEPDGHKHRRQEVDEQRRFT